MATPDRNANGNGNDVVATQPSQPFQDRTARARLANAEETAETRRMYQARKQEIERSLEQLSKRDQFLKRAIEHADALPDLHQMDETEDAAADAAQIEAEVPEAEGKKSKRKKVGKKGKTNAATGKAADERPCGFDLRFIDDEVLGEVASANDDEATARGADGDVEMRNGDTPLLDHSTTVCLAPRKKCDRHAGSVFFLLCFVMFLVLTVLFCTARWQKLRADDLDLARGNLVRRCSADREVGPYS